MTLSDRIGFMQGRLTPMAGGRIQSFPWQNWDHEIAQAADVGLHMMEWTLDQERLYENPLLTRQGQATIRELCRQHGFAIPSLTGDCFMQAPFWKAHGAERAGLQRDFLAIARACQAVGIVHMVVPLVDNGRLEDRDQEDLLVGYLQEQSGLLASLGLQVVFESDFAPAELARFIGRLDPARFGVNYDIGNSAALGFDPRLEFLAYGDRVLNVHVKDRVLGGTTVPLGTGNADFGAVFGELGRLSYGGRFILQTARATDDDHVAPLLSYRDMTLGWMERHGLLPS